MEINTSSLNSAYLFQALSIRRSCLFENVGVAIVFKCTEVTKEKHTYAKINQRKCETDYESRLRLHSNLILHTVYIPRLRQSAHSSGQFSVRKVGGGRKMPCFEHRELTSASHFTALFPPGFVEYASWRSFCSRFVHMRVLPKRQI